MFVNLLGYRSDQNKYEERDINENIIISLQNNYLLRINDINFVTHVNNIQKKSPLKFKKEKEPVIKTLKNLSKHKSIHTMLAGKGRAVVIH